MYPEDTSRIAQIFDTGRMLPAMEWYDRAKGRMADLGLNQADLESVLGVSRAGVSHYLTGRRDPSPKQLIDLARRLDVSLDTLLIGSEDTRRQSLPAIPDFERMAEAVTVLREYVEVTGGPDELVTDPIALQIAYEVVESFGLPVRADNVLNLTKILGRRIRGGEDEHEQRALRATGGAARGAGR